MKKIIYIFLDLLTIAFLIGGYAFQYFTRKKLGMLRWVNYQNMQIQKNPVYIVSCILLFNAVSWGSDTDADYPKWNCSGDKKE